VALADSEILQRGLDAFAELGYQGASVRELAKRLKVSHNFFNDRFGSKENFWRAVVDFAMTEPQRYIDAGFEDGDDADKFANVVKRFYSVAARSPQVNRIISAESVLDSGRLDYLYANYTGLFLNRLQPIAQRLMDAGRMPRMPLNVLFTAIHGPALALTHSQIAQRLGHPANPSAGEVERFAEMLACVVLRGLLPGAAVEPARDPSWADSDDQGKCK
jgi:TetR/AcrR family transcriptional regulator